MITVKKDNDGNITLSRVSSSGKEIYYTTPIGYTTAILEELGLTDTEIELTGPYTTTVKYENKFYTMNWLWTTYPRLQATPASNYIKEMKTNIRQSIEELKGWEIII